MLFGGTGSLCDIVESVNSIFSVRIFFSSLSTSWVICLQTHPELPWQHRRNRTSWRADTRGTQRPSRAGEKCSSVEQVSWPLTCLQSTHGLQQTDARLSNSVPEGLNCCGNQLLLASLLSWFFGDVMNWHSPYFLFSMSSGICWGPKKTRKSRKPEGATEHTLSPLVLHSIKHSRLEKGHLCIVSFTLTSVVSS